jgi:mycoredoxin
METSYELTEDDVLEVQTRLYAMHQETLRKNPRTFALGGLALGVLLWPLWGLATRHNPLFAETAPRLAVYLSVLGVAVATAYMLRSRFPGLRLPGLDAWMVRKMTRQALQRSVLGPITLTLGEQGLVRRNTRDELAVAWSEVRDILRSPRVLIVRLQEPQRVIVVPTRAFPDAMGEAAFLECLEALAGRKSVEVGSAAEAPAPPSKERARRPLLLTLLGFSVMLLVVDRGPVWYYDPRPANPPGHVIVYSTDWCPVCARLRECLQRHRIPFEERDIEKSARAEAEWSALDGTGVPLTVVGQRVAHGLRREQLQGALAEAGYRVDCWDETSPDERPEP